MAAVTTFTSTKRQIIQSARVIQGSNRAPAGRDRIRNRVTHPTVRHSQLDIQLASRQLEIGLEILVAGAASHVGRQSRSGWLLVPVNLFEVIANVLLVIRILRPARSVLVGGPEAGRIGGEDFIGKSDALGGASKLKLGVGDYDAALQRVGCRLFVNPQREIAQMAGGFDADDRAHLIEGNVLVVARCGLGRGREDALGKGVGLFQACGKGDAGNFAGGFVFFPGRAGDVSADDALDREHFGALHEHGAPAQLVGVFADGGRVLGDVGGDEVVGNDVGEVVEPEQGYLAEDVSLVGDAGGQDVVEGGDAVGGDEKQLLVADGVDVADFAAGVKVEIGEISL